MTDKQLERGNEIKKQFSELEKLKGITPGYSGFGIENLLENPVYLDFVKIEQRLNKRWHQLIEIKIAALKKEFAKL